VRPKSAAAVALAAAAKEAAPAAAAATNDTRQRVLEAAELLIRTEGLEALSFREVARRAGVSHQAPYHYFPDKQAILAALAQEGFALLTERLRAARSSAPTASARMEAIGQAYVSVALERPAHFKIMFRPELVKLDQFPQTVVCADEAFEELRLTVSELLAEGLGAPEEMPVVAALCWSVVHGLSGLLLDGPLLYKLGKEGSHELIAPVMAFLRTLVDARTAQHREPHRPAKGRGK
jgi:AcrR family transcriptional regulator